MGEFGNLEVSPALIRPAANSWSEEHDRLPLKQRLKLLLARSDFSGLFSDTGLEKDEISDSSGMAKDDFVRKEDGTCNSETFHAGSSLQKGKAGGCSCEQTLAGEQRDFNFQVVETNTPSADIFPAEKVNGVPNSSLSRTVSPDSMILVASCSSSSIVENHPFGCNLQQTRTDNGNPSDCFDELDHVVLKERQRLLLSSQTLRLTKTSLEGNTLQLPILTDSRVSQKSDVITKEETSYANKELLKVENHVSWSQKTANCGPSNAVITGLPYLDHGSSPFGHYCPRNKLVISGSTRTIQEKDGACSLEKSFTCSGPDSEKHFLSSKGVVPTISNLVKVKAEPLDINEMSVEKGSGGSLPLGGMIPLKSEPGIPNDFDYGMLDHMLLRERMKLLPAYLPYSDVCKMECSSKTVPSAVNCEPIAKESLKPLRISRPRKRKKTATDSVETALEEDAPGLLQALIQKGVSVDEIKLYGEPESDDALDDSFIEDNFTELEVVISKIFSQGSSLLKLPSLKGIKGEKASYCLACLFSLVEQSRHLLFKKWPVEWGWCRDLQAFIFVFARHNRIVLERPEYGFATYFFELMDSLPINWQIKRLVIAMKLTSCSRATLLENKPLVVGKDLTEGEAKVLIEYGWIPNTGLGTMLNYCDRVVHDRKNEDPSEWRSKIGKLLIDGYNGGSIVSTDVPKKVEYYVAENPRIKVETD